MNKEKKEKLMKKEEILQIWRNSNIITNFNVGFTKEEVLNRPAIIKTKNNYYYAGEKIKIEDIPTNGVIIQANTGISAWLLYENNNQVCLMSGYIRSWGSPVAKSKNKNTLKDWFIEYCNQTFVGVDCTKSNPKNKIDTIRYGIDLRRSVFVKTGGWYNNLPKHLTEYSICGALVHPQTLELIINNGGNSEEISAICARTSYGYGATASSLYVGYNTKGIVKYLTTHKTHKQNFPQEIARRPHTAISTVNDTLIIAPKDEQEIYYLYKNTWLIYRQNLGDKYIYAGKTSKFLGELLKLCRARSDSSQSFFEEIINNLPHICAVGNYKYTLEWFLNKTSLISLNIPVIFKLYIITNILRYHPNDHLFELWLKRETENFAQHDFASVFNELYQLGTTILTENRDQFKYLSTLIQRGGATPQHDIEIVNFFMNLLENPKYRFFDRADSIKQCWFQQYWNPSNLSKISWCFDRIKCFGYGYYRNFIAPTWSYKNICDQLHVGKSLFKYIVEHDLPSHLTTWCAIGVFLINYLNDSSGDGLGKHTKTQFYAATKKLQIEDFQHFEKLLEHSKDRWSRSYAIQELFQFITGSRDLLNMDEMIKVLRFIDKHNLYPLVNYNEYIRAVTNCHQNVLLDHTEAPSQFAQMNDNYIRNWARREDVLHYASLVDAHRSSSRWANTLARLREAKLTVQEYLITLHNFYSEIDTVLRTQAMLAQEKELNNKFEIAAKEFAKYSYEDDELMICPPHNLDELHNEGNTLHHCVFGFRQKMANKQSIIFFIRRKAAEDFPYYTVELVNDSTKWIRQVHGMRNSQPTPEIVSFLKKWVAKFQFQPDVKDTYNALG